MQFRRGNKEDLPQLAPGEPGFTLDTNELFVGGSEGNVSLTPNTIVDLKVLGATGEDGEDITSYINEAISKDYDIIIIPNKVARLSSNDVYPGEYNHTDGHEKIFIGQPTALLGSFEIKNADIREIYYPEKYGDVNTRFMEKVAMPPKALGDRGNSSKLLHKIDDTLTGGNNSFDIFQKSGSRYNKYRFTDSVGTSDGSAGGTWGLHRCIDVEDIWEIWVAKKETSGQSVGVTKVKSDNVLTDKKYTLFERDYLFASGKYNEDSIYSNEAATGLPVHAIPQDEYIEYEINISTHYQDKNSKMNVAVITSDILSGNAEIQIADATLNWHTIKTFSTKDTFSAGETVKLIEFEIPYSSDTLGTLKIRVVNKDTVDLWVACLNLMRLRNVNKHEVDYFIAAGLGQHYINTTGSLDYALNRESDGLWYGSTHGGEISENLVYYSDDGKISALNWGTNDFSICENLMIRQETRIVDADDDTTILLKTRSYWYFDQNGTLGFKYSFFEGDFDVGKDFMACLTTTHYDFNSLFSPINVNLEALSDGESIYLPLQEGYVHQKTSNNFNVIHRFSMCNDAESSLKVWHVVGAYNKFYYSTLNDKVIEAFSMQVERDFFKDTY